MTHPRRAHSVAALSHLEGMLSLYADRSLPAATLLACDRHVLICPGCLAAVEAERRLLASLRTAATPGLSSRLESSLLDLAGHSAGPLTTGGSVRGPSPSPLSLMGQSAPAMYRSPLRAAVLAGLVAGASAATAWSLGVNGIGSSGGSLPVARPPAAAAPATAPPGASTSAASSSQVVSFLDVNSFHFVGGPEAGVPNVSRHSAQSIHE